MNSVEERANDVNLVDLGKAFPGRGLVLLKVFCSSYARPLIQFAIQVWYQYIKQDIEKSNNSDNATKMSLMKEDSHDWVLLL